MTTITRRAQDLRSRFDAAVAVAVVFTTICLAVAAGAFVAATKVEPPLPAAPLASSESSEPKSATSMSTHDDHMS